MGSDFYSFEEASIKLKCSKRTIYNYVRKGLIRKLTYNGEVVLRKDDVEQVSKDEEIRVIPSKKIILQLSARIRRLEEDMAVCRRMFSIRGEPLQFSNETAVGIYKAAIKALNDKSYSKEEITTWSDLINRFDENSLEFISKATSYNDSWKPIYKLCLRFLEQLSQNNLQDRDLFLKLDEGRKKLRESILVWLEMGNRKLPTPIIESLNSERERLLSRLTARNSKSV